MRRLIFLLCLCLWLPVAVSAEDNEGSAEASQTAEDKKPAVDKKNDETKKPSTSEGGEAEPDCD